MAFVTLGRGFNDEYMVSDFAEACYLGDKDKVLRLLEENPDSRRDPMALYLALRGGHRELFEHLVQAGVAVPESLYRDVLLENESYLVLLPENPSLVKKARQSIANLELSRALLNGEATESEIEDLLRQGADPNAVSMVSRALQGYTPFNLACRYPSVKIIELLLKAGADPTPPPPEQTCNLRMILRSDSLTRAERFLLLRLCRHYGLEPRPPLSWIEKLQLFLGNPIH